MKKIFIVMAAFAAVMTVSCNKEANVENKPVERVIKTFTCAIDSDADSKVAIPDDGKAVWEVGDEIYIHGYLYAQSVTHALTAEEISADGKMGVTDLLKVLDGDKFLDAVIHLSGFESVDIAYITWAMAKAADEDIPDPRTWIKQFDSFPMDVVVPEVFSLALKGLASSKNLKRLKDLASQIKVVQPISTSTQSSSPDLNED